MQRILLRRLARPPQGQLLCHATRRISTSQYHERANDTLETLLDRCEELQEKHDGVDVEYTQGVLTLSLPSIGTYVINKQPPNKQIWLSSPLSGPKRYDWIDRGKHSTDESVGNADGDWIYARDKSTMRALLDDEVFKAVSDP